MTVDDPLVQAALLGEAVDQGPTAVFVADEEGRYVAVNRAACALLGYSREELLALSVADVAENRGRWEELQERGTISGTTQLLRKDGTRAAFSWTAGRTVVAGMPVYVSVGIAGDAG
jgi:PAS domain S-box-containing protein